MSTHHQPEPRSEEQHSTTPACDTNLTGTTTAWQERPAAVYPPGYPPLCTDPACFGSHVPDEAWNGDGTADWDHREAVSTLVCSTQRGTKRRMHLPESVEAER